jgi:hypothetical protein
MTVQFDDHFELAGESFIIGCASPEPLFNPTSVGLAVHPSSTACVRGYALACILDGKRLLIADMYVELDRCDRITGKAIDHPVINGVPATVQEDLGKSPCNFLYRGVRLFLPYTGGMLLCAGDVDRPLIGLAGHPAGCFATVLELEFSGGRLLRQWDRSADCRTLREAQRERPMPADVVARFLPDDETKGWLAQTFAREYDRFLG